MAADANITQELDVSNYTDGGNYWAQDGSIVSGSDNGSIIAQIVDEFNSLGGGHHYYEHNLGGTLDPGDSRLTKVIAEVMGNEETSAGYGVGSNLGNGDNDTSLLGRIAQELDGYNLDVSVGSSGTAIDRIEQEFEEKQSSLNSEASTRTSEDTILAASIVSNSNTLSLADSNLLVNITSVSNTLSSVDSNLLVNITSTSNALMAADATINQELDVSNYIGHGDNEWSQDGHVDGSSDNGSIIAQIVDEFNSHGGGHHYYEHNLGGNSPFESRLTKVIAEVMGNEDTSAGYGVGSSLGNADDDTSLLGRIAQELDGYNLDASVGSSGTAIDRIEQEFSDQEVQIASLNNTTNDLYSLIADLQNQIDTLSARVTTLESSSNSTAAVTSEMVEDGRVGSTAFSVHNNTASIQMNLETTTDLAHGDWSPSTNVNIVIPVNGESTQFFRMDFE